MPDGEPVGEALRAAVADGVDVVVTSGGTGITPTDRTPEVTRAVLDYEIPGIAEAIRAYSRDRVPTSVLSRGLAGVAGRRSIVNLPGSTGGARDGAGRARTDPGARRGAAPRRRPLTALAAAESATLPDEALAADRDATDGRRVGP